MFTARCLKINLCSKKKHRFIIKIVHNFISEAKSCQTQQHFGHPASSGGCSGCPAWAPRGTSVVSARSHQLRHNWHLCIPICILSVILYFRAPRWWLLLEIEALLQLFRPEFSIHVEENTLLPRSFAILNRAIAGDNSSAKM